MADHGKHKAKKPARKSAFNQSQARRQKRISIMGKKGAAKQDAREARGTLAATFKGPGARAKNFGKQAIKRVGEYKRAVAKKAATKKKK